MPRRTSTMLKHIRLALFQCALVLLLLGIIMAPAGASARSHTLTRSSSGTTITLLSFNSAPNYVAWYHFVIAQFAKTHPGFSVKLRFTDPTHITALIKTGVASGQ